MKKNIADALEMVRKAMNYKELQAAVSEVDRMFLADKQEITMSCQDWVTLNEAIANSPVLKNMESSTATEANR